MHSTYILAIKGGVFVDAKVKKSRIADFFKVVCSGLFCTVLTLLYTHFLNPPQSFTFLYNGNEVIVTEAEYMDLVEQNTSLTEQLETQQSEYVELIEQNTDLAKQLEALQGELSSLQAQIESQESIQAIEQLLKQATDYWNNSDYIQALTALKNSSIQSEDIQTLYSSYSAEYTLNLLAQADKMISEKRYDDAISLLTAGQNLVSDPTDIQHKVSEIRDNDPIKLSELKITSSRFFDLQDSKSLVDTVGNSYPSGNLFTTRARGDSEYGYASFYLGKKYTGITGIIAVSDESEDSGLEGWIEIYSVTNEEYSMLYKSPLLSRMSIPIELPELNLSGADWIEIRYYNKENYFSLSYHSLQIIISDIMLYSL